MDPSVRDLTGESGYEYGSRAGIWRIARALDDYGVRATFLACAVALERNLEVAAYIREQGHEPCCHGWRWEEVFRLTREEEREHMLAAIASLRETCGERPVGWYVRATPSAHTRELLVEEGGFLYDSDAYNDDLPYFVEVLGRQHLVVPYSFVYNDSRFVLAPGYAHPDDFTELCSRGLRQLRREGQAGFPKLMSVGVHPRWIGQAGRIDALARLLEEARAAGDVWIATRREIAEWWLAHHHEFAR
jgi:peptidoglycan/xylan/chitin deacetylase (PgdA/CDA1 family)